MSMFTTEALIDLRVWITWVCFKWERTILFLPLTTKLRRYCFRPCLLVCFCLSVSVNNFLTTVLVVEWWNFQGLIAMWRSGRDSFLKGQERAKGQIHWIGYNFASNYHREKLGSYFSLWKAAPNMTLTFDLEKFAQGQNFWNKLRKTV